MAKLMDRIKDLDLYLLLGITPDAEEKAIKKAYRKKALTCHPDKNPDNPKAAEEFHQLSDAYEVLTDADAKKAYDNVLKARKANELRNRQLDAKRRKLKDDLEAREREAADSAFATVVAKKTEEERLAAEIERLRKEGSRQLEEEQEAMKKLLEDEAKERQRTAAQSQSADTTAKIKLKWKEREGETVKYDKETLRRIFSKYCDVGDVLVIPKSKGSMSGLVEMSSKSAAKMAVQIEIGFAENPLKVKLVDEDPVPSQQRQQPHQSSFPSAGVSSSDNLRNDNDFESLVMRKMRQEEERKRLIREMEEQDAREEAEAAKK